MRQMNQQAWEMLMEDEKQAIILQHGHNKSSWKAGEILSKSHYKYLEIKYRAEKFLKMFTEHLELWDELIPKSMKVEEEIREYFILCIGKRKKLKEVSDIINTDYADRSRSEREELIIKTFKDWSDNTNPAYQELINLIKEFDRWNNFRILPKDIQEPSAYNRRLKNVHKRLLKVSTKFPDISVPMVGMLHGWKKGNKAMYLPIITENQKSHVIKLRNVKPVFEAFSEMGLYVFEKEIKANEYLTLVKKYLHKDKSERRCKDGLEFWPKYRILMKEALNYEAIQNITPTRRYLELALEKFKYL